MTTPTIPTCIRCLAPVTRRHCPSPTCPWWMCQRCAATLIAGRVTR